MFNESEIEEYKERFNEVAKIYIDRPEFEIEEILKRKAPVGEINTQIEQDLQTMISLGIYSRGILEDFFEIQKQLLNK